MPFEISTNRRNFLSKVVMTIAAAELGVAGCVKALKTRAVQLPAEGDLPSLGGSTGWLNSQPLTTRGLRGRVVVNFWTTSCINSIRVLPYLCAWASKYNNQGFRSVATARLHFRIAA